MSDQSDRSPRSRPSADAEALFFFERRDLDLPFYRGTPVGLSHRGWQITLAATALGFATLVALQPLGWSGFAAFIPAILFVLIPLASLATAAGWTAVRALFHPLRRLDWALMAGFALLNLGLTLLLGLVILRLFNAVENPAGAVVAAASGAERLLFFGWTAIQLLGEEIFTILPFLAFLTFLNTRMSRSSALALAALGAAVIFALAHLPTYQWNLAQALVGLVPVRIVLLLPYVITRNIWVSTGAHILNDWAIFSLGMLPGSAA